MVSESERLARIVEDLLDLSIVEAQERAGPRAAAGHRARRRRGRPGPVGGRSTRASRSTRRTCPPNLRVECDRRQVVSAIYNLLDNAVKYSEVGPAGRGDGRAARRPLRDRGARPRHRHPVARSRTGLRALLPRRPGAQPPDRRHRPRSRDRAPRRAEPRRRGHGRVARRRRHHLHAAPARPPRRSPATCPRRPDGRRSAPRPRRRRRAVVPRRALGHAPTRGLPRRHRGRRRRGDRALRRDAARARSCST